MRILLVALAILLGAMTAACGTSASDDGPPEINYGRDICVQCGMIINEERFAAAYTLDDGTEKSFDDVGGLLLHQRATGDSLNLDHVWVHDSETADWVNATDAYFVASLSTSTPMGHGILAFSDELRAHAFAAGVGGEVVRWETVFAMPEQNGLVGQHHTETPADHNHEG